MKTIKIRRPKSVLRTAPAMMDLPLNHTSVNVLARALALMVQRPQGRAEHVVACDLSQRLANIGNALEPLTDEEQAAYLNEVIESTPF